VVKVERRTVRTTAEALGAFAAALRYEDLPAAAATRATQLTLDVIGLTLGGQRTPAGRALSAFAAARLPGDGATIIGDGRRASAEGAAFVNAAVAKIVGMEDTNRAYGHVAVEVVPAALAAAETARRSGRDLIRSVVAGYEIFGRVGRQVRRAHLERGLDIKGTVGAIGAAAAAGAALGLDGEHMGHALAIATCLSSGLETYVHDPEESHTEYLISGFAARNGVAAARLAGAGFRGPRGALDGAHGFARAFGDGFDGPAPRDLGVRFEIDSAGVKPHAGCRHVHQAVDAALEARRQGPLDLDRVARIDVGTYLHAVAAPFRTTLVPASPAAAGYSLPVATVVALVFGGFSPEDIPRYTDERVRRLLPKVDVHVDPEIQAGHPRRNGCVVRVTLDDGRVVEGRVEYARGEPENMLADREFEDKFRVLAGDLLAAPAVDRWIAALWALNRVDDVGTVVAPGRS
jgi:2-methylcitrate dehydratase PrpD